MTSSVCGCFDVTSGNVCGLRTDFFPKKDKQVFAYRTFPRFGVH